MFKPLLRTIPCLSGNFTLACKLDTYKKNSPINFECGISNAVLMPLQNNLANKHINVSLLYNAYEYDIKEYFKSFSSIFYNENYEYDRNNVYDINLTGNPTYKNRNLDYEFGCKRNIMNSGYQYMFYAPFYINDTTSLPDEFIIHIDFDDNRYKEIHIKIFDNSSDVTNYLSVYLKRYVEQIDEKCIFCLPQTNQGTYYGVDVQYGGFKNVRDNVIGVIYNKQLSLNDYDKIICNGFQRNKLIMRQIVPLSFMFNVEDILTKSEYRYNVNNIMRISGWYERHGMKYDFYDFDTDYKELIINNVNILNPTDADIKHNKNLRKALYEGVDISFKNDNTISKTYNRWCLLSTLNDENKYIINSSNIFLDENNNYYNIPIRYSSNSSYLNYDNYDIDLNNSRNALLNNNLDSIVTQTLYSEKDILNENNWYDVMNNKCIIGGLLYDLNNLSYTYTTDYSNATNNVETFSKYQKIDKFNVFAYVNILNSDNSYYCKYTINSDEQYCNSITYNNYSYSFFKHNIAEYNSIYESLHLNDTLFDKLSYVIDDNNKVILIDKNGNDVTDNIYIDYSYHYYLSNMYEIEPNTSYSKIYGYEILNDIDPLSFIKELSKENPDLDSDFIKNNFVLMNYSSDNIKLLKFVDPDDDINVKNSRIAVKRILMNTYDKYDFDERYEKVSGLNNEETLNEKFHYVPSYKSASFTSKGHFERNNIHNSYIYCDMWNLLQYIKEWNSEHNAPYILSDAYINNDNIVNNAYIGFVNVEQYKYYANRMYGYDMNNMNNCTYVLKSIANCHYDNNGSSTSNPYLIGKIYRTNEFITLDEYLGDNANNKEEIVEELINSHRLYHKNKLLKLSSDFVKQIKTIFKELYYNNNDALSFILYTSNTDIIDQFNINEIRQHSTSDIVNKGYEIYIPLSKEILWSRKSQKETYDILSSRNVKLDRLDYAVYDLYDLVNCNNAGDIENINEICENDNTLLDKFYKLVNVNQIECDNTLHIVKNNDTTFAYYYITLNLFNNANSFIMNTNNINNTFDINKYPLYKLIPFLSSNLLDYILLNMSENSIMEQNILSIIMNKYFDKSQSTVLINDNELRELVSRYFNDITPVLIKTSFVKPYSIIYKNKNISSLNGDIICNEYDHYDSENDEHIYNRTIEYDSNIYKNKEFGLPYVSSGINTNEHEFVEEYEYKFYNDNKIYLLEPYFTITDETYYTIEEIREHEKNEYVLNNIFKPRILNKMHHFPENEDEILFLFNRYKVEYESYPIKTDLTGEVKLHKLKYIFTLI